MEITGKIQEPDMSALLKRVRDDGTKLMLIDNAESWMSKLRAVAQFPVIKYFILQKLGWEVVLW